mmetsp:Transcript_24859/g.48329  ORF Transcript_24859/g.48329 Transcript_24859/m.48329 type:complete len:91 (-) Transcript_24859:124-396(-)
MLERKFHSFQIAFKLTVKTESKAFKLIDQTESIAFKLILQTDINAFNPKGNVESKTKKMKATQKEENMRKKHKVKRQLKSSGPPQAKEKQ